MLLKISTRSLLLGAVLFGISFTPIFAETATSDGPNITDGTGPQDESKGDPGTDGQVGEDGGNGGNGGNITSVVPGSSSSNNDGVAAASIGGDGGKGGEGDGEGRDPGDGGNGGNGGTVDLTLTGESYGSVSAQSRGGKAGEAGQGVQSQAVGGNGGDVSVTIADTGSVVGNVMAGSIIGDSNGQNPNGHSGDVTVIIEGTVTGNIYAASAGDQQTAGTVKVVIDGGVVTGDIIASTSKEQGSSLTFKFDVADRSEYKAATAVLTGQQSTGTVTINGHEYNWQGFSSLVDMLKYVGPDDKVVVSVKETASETTTVGEPASPPRQAKQQPKIEDEPAKPRIVAGIEVIEGKPEMAKCSGGSEIRTVRLDNGSVVVIHHNRGADTLIGQLEGGEFHRASDAPDWVVRVGDEGRTVDVSDASGSALTSCSFG